MKPPEDCQGMPDIREAVDPLDRQVIGLIGHRAEYVQAAAKFKTGEADVRAPGRQEAMLEERRSWADEEGLDPDVIEKVYHDLVSYFVSREMKDWKTRD